MEPKPNPVITKSGFRKPALRVKKQTPKSVVDELNKADDSAEIDLQEEAKRTLKWLLWLYYFFLIFEGAFRKWWLPQYSNYLLLVRDPIVVAIYFIAYQQKIVAKERLYTYVITLAFASTALAFIQSVLLNISLPVVVYGLRTDFLHFPLVFIMPFIFDRIDLEKLAKVTLVLAIPMAILMAYQFESPPDAYINKTVGLTGGPQLSSALGKIRPPGTFSFISGPVSFFALVTAFVGYGLVAPSKPITKWLLVSALIALGLGVAVSGSRATILSGGIVVAAWFVTVVAGRRKAASVANSLIAICIAGFVLGQIEIVYEGREVLNQRFEMGAGVEAESGGLIGRYLSAMSAPLQMALLVPIFGSGLGVGTNVGANYLTGKMQFLLAEGEWGRIIYESGPIFGLLYLGFRVGLAVYLGKGSFGAVRNGHVLPLLLFSACLTNILNGQIAQPTTLGFTAFVAGLCLTSLVHIPKLQPEPA